MFSTLWLIFGFVGHACCSICICKRSWSLKRNAPAPELKTWLGCLDVLYYYYYYFVFKDVSLLHNINLYSMPRVTLKNENLEANFFSSSFHIVKLSGLFLFPCLCHQTLPFSVLFRFCILPTRKSMLLLCFVLKYIIFLHSVNCTIIAFMLIKIIYKNFCCIFLLNYCPLCKKKACKILIFIIYFILFLSSQPFLDDF